MTPHAALVAAHDARTPEASTPDHDPVIDLLHTLALLAVVLGHWLMQGFYVDPAGELHRGGLLAVAQWTHPLTWIFQVMPLIFAIGGYANARSWRRARASAGYGAWLRVRVLRLTRPLVPFLTAWFAIAVSAPALLGTAWLGVASSAGLVLTWFLAVYLGVVALAPLAVAAWDRWGWWSAVAGLVGAGAVDLVSLATPWQVVGMANMLAVWLTLHQLGVAWQSGRLEPVAGAIGAVGILGLLVLVGPGPYAVVMVGTSGEGISNTHPTRVTLLLLGMAQVGFALAVRPLLARIAAVPLVGLAMRWLGTRLMTVYLWHLTVFALFTAGSVQLGGWGLVPRPAGVEWWRQQPLWLAALALTTLAVVLVLGRFEFVPTAGGDQVAAWPSVLTVLVTVVGLALLADGWLVRADVVHWYLPLFVLAAPVVLGRERPRRRRDPGYRPRRSRSTSPRRHR